MKRDSGLHLQAYNAFREYLNTAYSYGGGQQLIGLSTGYPSSGLFQLSSNVLEALSVQTSDGKERPRAGYGWESGSRSLREAIIEYQNLLHGTTYSLEHISIVAGGSYGLNRVLEHLAERRGDRGELVIIAPAYFRMTGRFERWFDVTSVVGAECNDFQVTTEQVLAALSNRTSAVVMYNPTNPTFKYHTNKILGEIIDELAERGVFLIIDESGDAYRSIQDVWKPRQLPSNIDSSNVIRIITASKQHLLAEFRLGYVLAGKQVMGDKEHGFVKLIGDDMGNPPLAANEAFEVMVRAESEYVRSGITNNHVESYNRTIRSLAQKLELCVQALKGCSEIESIIEPDANYNVTFRVRPGSWTSDLEFMRALAREEKVALLPCSGFGLDPRRLYFRLTYALPKERLVEGLTRLVAFVERHRH